MIKTHISIDLWMSEKLYHVQCHNVPSVGETIQICLNDREIIHGRIKERHWTAHIDDEHCYGTMDYCHLLVEETNDEGEPIK